MNTLLVLIVICFISNILCDEQLPEIIDSNSTEIIDNNQILALKAVKFGFNSFNTDRLLNSILNNPVVVSEESNYKLFQLADEKYLTISDFNPIDQISSDIAFIYVDKLFLINSQLAIEKLFNALSAILSSNKKPSLVLIISCKSNDTKKYADLLGDYITDAWNLIDKSKASSNNINLAIDIEIISVGLNTIEVSNKATDLINELIVSQSNYTRPENLLYNNTNNISKIESNRLIDFKYTLSTDGVANIDFAVYQVIVNINEYYKSSVNNIQRAVSIELFPKYINDLISLSHDTLVNISNSNNITNQNIITSGKNELNRYVYSLYYPVYLRHIQTIKKQIVEKFNEKFNEIEISIYMDEDFKKLQNEIINLYTKRLNKLKPKTSPLSWDFTYDIYTLNKNFREFIDKECDKQRLTGVLKRDIRLPIDISIHCFLTHPLGRDYRQDPIGVRENVDLPIYDKNLANSKEISIHPSKGNILIKNSLLTNKLNKNDKEFLREMLMFPLSIKNPAVPLMGSRGKKSYIVPRKDLKRHLTGPERFIRWDIEPMDEIKENIDNLIEENKQNIKIPLFDQVVNLVPLAKRAYYIEPPIKYGSQYGPK